MNPSPDRLRVLHVIANINSQMGGPSRSVTHLAVETARRGHAVGLASMDYPEFGPALETPGVERMDFSPAALTRSLGGFHPAFSRYLFKNAPALDIIHNHGIWLWTNHYAARAARAHGTVLVTSPRGMLGSWALQRRQLLKKIVWTFREYRDLSDTTAFHATSREEAASIRDLGFRQPIAIIPNGVDLPPPHAKTSNNSKRKALFLSRLHPKKGIPDLLSAWALLPEDLRKIWKLHIAGTGSPSYVRELKENVHRLSLEDAVEFCGEVEGVVKQRLLEEAEILILPSHEENFGIVVAEALAHGTPVLTSHGTPWKNLEEKQCGWCIPVGSGPLAEKLPGILSLSHRELEERGAQGRSWMEEDFSWPSAAEKMAFFYHWLLHGGSIPGFVDTLP